MTIDYLAGLVEDGWGSVILREEAKAGIFGNLIDRSWANKDMKLQYLGDSKDSFKWDYHKDASCKVRRIIRSRFSQEQYIYKQGK